MVDRRPRLLQTLKKTTPGMVRPEVRLDPSRVGDKRNQGIVMDVADWFVGVANTAGWKVAQSLQHTVNTAVPHLGLIKPFNQKVQERLSNLAGEPSTGGFAWDYKRRREARPKIDTRRVTGRRSIQNRWQMERQGGELGQKNPMARVPQPSWYGMPFQWHPTRGPINPKADQAIPPSWLGPPRDQRNVRNLGQLHRSEQLVQRAQGTPFREGYRKRAMSPKPIIYNSDREPRSA